MQVHQKRLPKPLSLDYDIPSDIGALQKEDPTLKPWFEKVTEQDGIRTAKASCLD